MHWKAPKVPENQLKAMKTKETQRISKDRRKVGQDNLGAFVELRGTSWNFVERRKIAKIWPNLSLFWLQNFVELRGTSWKYRKSPSWWFRVFGCLLVNFCWFYVFFTFLMRFCTFCMFCKCFCEIGLHLLQMASTQLALPGVKMLTALLFLVDWCSPVWHVKLLLT